MDLLNYYGLDWIGTVLILLCIYLVGEQERKGFIYGMLGCCLWLIFGFLAESYATIVANIVFLVMYGRGYLKWKRKADIVATQQSEY